MRRIATVTICRAAGGMRGLHHYPSTDTCPVPTMRREVELVLSDPAAYRSSSRSASCDRFDDLDAVAVAESFELVLGSANDAIVACHRDAVARRAQELEERAQRSARRAGRAAAR